MGQISKESLRQQAKNTGFKYLIDRKESTGLCFANGRSCAEILKDYIPGLDKRIGPGIVIDKRGKQIGRHNGYVYYTIGQKQGLELNINEKLCVTGIDPENNILEVGMWESLYQTEIAVEDYHFPDISELHTLDSIQVKVRGFGLNPEGNCKVQVSDDNRLIVILDNPAWAPAPGQPAVFYSGNKLLGGGIISSS
jgi:tRNA-specific 2-thiouridylase